MICLHIGCISKKKKKKDIIAPCGYLYSAPRAKHKSCHKFEKNYVLAVDI